MYTSINVTSTYHPSYQSIQFNKKSDRQHRSEIDISEPLVEMISFCFDFYWKRKSQVQNLVVVFKIYKSQFTCMQEQKVTTLFNQLIATPQKALQAHITLKEAIVADPTLLPSILELLTNNDDPTPQQNRQHFHIVVLLHPVLVDLFSDLPSETQDEVRSGLLSIVVAQHSNLKTVAALGLLAREILQIDGVDPWVEPLGQLMKWAQSQELATMLAGIEFFLYLLKETSHTKSNCDAGLHKLASILLQKLFAVFASQELGQHNRAKLLCLVLQIIKTFSPLDGVEDATVKSSFDGTFELWMSLFISALQGSLNLNLSIKKYILKILVVIYRDMQSYLTARKYHQPAHIFTIWEFTYRVIPIYLWSHVWGYNPSKYPPQPKTETSTAEDQDYIQYDDESDALCSTIEGLALAALDFISVILSVPQLQGALRVSTHHLTNTIFHYLLISNQELEGWKSNAHHFSSQIGSLQYEAGVRGKGLSILNEMIQKYGDSAIQAILIASQKFLLNLPQESTIKTFEMIINAMVDPQDLPAISGGIYESDTKYMNLAKLSGVDVRAQLQVPGQTWHKIQAGLLVLGRFSEDVIVFQSKQGGSFDIEGFVKGIVRQVREQDYYSLLKGQSLYCLTRFIEIISIKYRHLFCELVAAALSCNVPGAPLSLRLVACKSLSSFLKKMDKHKLEFQSETLALAQELQPIERVCQIPLLSQTASTVIETLIELCKRKDLTSLARPPAEYFLALFHQCLSQQSLIQPFLGLLEGIINNYSAFSSLSSVFISFCGQCLKAYLGALKTDQKKFLKAADSDLIMTALQVAGVFTEKLSVHSDSTPEKERIIQLVTPAVEIMEINQDVPLQVALSLFVKSVVRAAQTIFASRKDLTELIIHTVRLLLRIPKDKSFESGSIYAGNLAIILFDKLLGRNHNQILQEIVLKVFRSRTPSVIQSLVLVYSRLINKGVSQQNKFVLSGEAEARAKGVVDFLSSFSIENRMGLKILIDKWLLQQSLFRGKHTKTATFMALSRLFLLNDKRVDNLLVIGFNPSHTNVNNDVNAPLKILATLIRCLDNEVSGSRGTQDDESDEENNRMETREEGLAVELEKFKEEQEPRPEEQRIGGSLADRQNQQGSTCYMSAMLQFYDDGEECDDKTQQDLLFLKDSSIEFNLAEYLTQFFTFLNENRNQYFKECIKGLLRQDVRTLQKYIKI